MKVEDKLEFLARRAAQRTEMLKTMRGRRYLICEAMRTIDEVIKSIPDGPYIQPKDGVIAEEGPFPGSSPGMRMETLNLSAVLIRMILQQNDGRVSADALTKF